MKRKFLFLLWIGILVVIYSCSGRKSYFNKRIEFRKVVQEMENKRIVFPDTLLSLFSESQRTIINNDGEKIVSVVSANCNKCVYELNKWKPILKEMQGRKETDKLIFIIEGMESDSFEKEFSNNIPSQIHFYFDSSSIFSRSNNLPNIKMLNTFMLDKYNNILIVGNPSLDKKIWNLYERELENK